MTEAVGVGVGVITGGVIGKVGLGEMGGVMGVSALINDNFPKEPYKARKTRIMARAIKLIFLFIFGLK